MVKNLPAMRGMKVQYLVWEDSMEKGMATHSSTLAWRISWTEETGGLWSIGLKRETNEQLQHVHTHTHGLSSGMNSLFYLKSLFGTHLYNVFLHHYPFIINTSPSKHESDYF